MSALSPLETRSVRRDSIMHRAPTSPPTYAEIKRNLHRQDRRILEDVVERRVWGPDEVRRLVIEEHCSQQEAYARVRGVLRRSLYALGRR